MGTPPFPGPWPTSIVTAPLVAVNVSIGASGISGTQTAASAMLDTGVIVSIGSKVSTPDDQASKINLDLEIPTTGATSTVVFGSINCVAGATPVVAPAIE